MEKYEEEPIPLTEIVRHFGIGLSGGQWSLDTSMTQLAEVFHTMGGDSTLIESDMQQLEQADTAAAVTPASPFFNKIIAMMTRGIVLLDELDTPLPSDVDVVALVEATTEGVTWDEPGAKRYRDMLTDRNAGLLRTFAEGLSEDGASLKDVKAIMRQETEAILNEVSSRTSFAAIRFVKVLSTITKKAELTNWETRVSTARRGIRAARKIGANVYRLT